MALSSIPEILAEFRAGRMVILVDEEDRENEGDLVLAADFVTPEAINFMARFGRGLICLTLTEERCRRLELPLMTASNGARTGTNFTVSIEAAEGVTTGISAADRARTVAAAVARNARAEDIVQPGHIFPLMARPGGVLARAGHTEAGCDLGALAGLTPAAVICEIMNEDGTMARLPDLVEFARQHQLKIGAIADLIQYRSATESLVERLSTRRVETAHGPFELTLFRDKPTGQPHLALMLGDPAAHAETLVRVHEPTTLLDLIDTSRGTHAWSVHRALATIRARGHGVLVMLNAAVPAEGIFAQGELMAQLASGNGVRRRTTKFDMRTYGTGAQILKELGVRRMRLLTSPRKLPSVTGYDLEIVGYETGETGEG
jgi:3,4-dihydroxy 2-butanone 4-phosphate synthase/GTP cyclohydrolase II